MKHRNYLSYYTSTYFFTIFSVTVPSVFIFSVFFSSNNLGESVFGLARFFYGLKNIVVTNFFLMLKMYLNKAIFSH